jgi:hypothetical protein
MLINQADPKQVSAAIEQFEALVAIEKLTHTKTTRARNDLLQSLASPELVAVSLELRRRGLIGGGSR